MNKYNEILNYYSENDIQISPGDMNLIHNVLTEESEILQNKQTKNISFFGKSIKVTVQYNGYHGGEFDKKTTSLVNKALNSFCSKGLWSYIYKLHSNLIKDINSDPYFNGKKLNSAQDLIDSVDIARGLKVYCNPRNDNEGDYTIYICGECWWDEEHGFCVTFPNGNIVRVKDPKEGYDKKWHVVGTVLGQASDPL